MSDIDPHLLKKNSIKRNEECSQHASPGVRWSVVLTKDYKKATWGHMLLRWKAGAQEDSGQRAGPGCAAVDRWTVSSVLDMHSRGLYEVIQDTSGSHPGHCMDKTGLREWGSQDAGGSAWEQYQNQGLLYRQNWQGWCL